MIDLSQELIVSMIIKAFISGIMLGLLYEAVRVLRMLMTPEHSVFGRVVCAVFVFFCDFIFCLLFASVAMLLTYNLSEGVFRGCMYLAMALGLLSYRATLGRLVFKLECCLVKLLKKIFVFFVRSIIFPFKLIFSVFLKLYRLTIGKIIGKIVCKVRKRIKMSKIRLKKASSGALLPLDGQEEEKNVDKQQGYKKEERISFGRSR